MDSPFRTSLSCIFHWLVFLPLLAYIHTYTRKWHSIIQENDKALCILFTLLLFFSIGKINLNLEPCFGK